MKKYCLLIFLWLFAGGMYAKGQSVPVGTVATEDYYRRAQLSGALDSTVSFTIRPLYTGNVRGLEADSTGKFYRLLPLTLLAQYNSHHPFGWNDGAMIPAKGLQTLLTGGFFAEYGPLSIQLKPEFLFAANNSFETFNKDHYDVITARYYDFYNNIDLPVRFGDKSLTKVSWGQSSIRVNYKDLSFGLSTENLWWGPGMRNSLLMSNTAPGFKHLSLNTRRPVSSPVGSFEGQLIAGRLENSGYGVLEPERAYFKENLYFPKPDDWRYLSGLAITWQPKWVPGLFLGLTRTAQYYSEGLKFGDYFPFFTSKKQAAAAEPVNNKRDQRNSYFIRWLWPEEKAEVYMEYGRNNYSGSLNDVALEPNVSRAYIFGVRKLFPFRSAKDESLMLSVEVAQLQETAVQKVLGLNSWYTSKSIRQGYTHRGEVLGAGIGPGANFQSLELSWVKGLKRIGLQIERYVHNDDFYYYVFYDSMDWRRHWVDLSFAAAGEWSYQNFIFNAKIQGIHSYNYQWYLYSAPGDPYMTPGKDVFNLQLQAGFTYRF